MKALIKFFSPGVILCLIFASGFGAEKDRASKPPLKTTGSPVNTYFNINNISTVFWNNGNSDIDVQNANSGFVFPKGSRKTAIFSSGFLWGGKVNGQVRVGGSAYRTGLQCGKILPSGVAEDPNLAKNRIYRVRLDFKEGDLSAELGDEGGSVDGIRARYQQDWNEWPWRDGAPYTQKGPAHQGYDPATDIPGVKGADQTIWYVANDLNTGLTTNLYGATPIGFELQVTVWGYAQQGALGNMLFRKYLLINRSGTQIDSMYVSQWSDPDLGNASDDYAGCDTTLSLGYVYNANASDATYAPLPPPAAGFDFFQGPVVPGLASDSAIYLGKRIGGKKNLPMTAFYYFANGDANVTDPTQGSYDGTLQFYNFFKGRIGRTGQIFTDPNGVQTVKVLAGDPQTRTGWVDGQILPAGDRRIGLASGPFTMAATDTQEIVVAELAAGAIVGTDRLSCIGLLKFYDQQAQLAYDNFFDLPTPPPSPKVTNAELDRKIVLSWGDDLAAVSALEGSNSKGYKFQGYNVYQLPSASATIDAAKRIATYDVIDGIGKIEDFFFDPATGVVARKVKQFGNDTGILRSLNITTDELKGGTPLINGIRYYFAITAYNYNPAQGAVPNNLESPITIFTIVPHSLNPGIRYANTAGDTGNVVHAGVSDGKLIPIVVDPNKVKDKTYKVTFKDTTRTFYLQNSVGDRETLTTVVQEWMLSVGADTVYRSFNQGPNVSVIPGSENLDPAVNPVFGDEFNYPIIDGIRFSVSGSLPGMKSWEIIGTRRFSPVNGFTGLGLEGFSNAGDPTAYDQAAGTIGMAGHLAFGGIGTTLNNTQYHNVVLKLAAVDPANLWNPLTAPTDPNFSKAYRYLRAASAPAEPSFAPWIIHTGSGYPYQAFDYSVPFSAWDMETTPPTRLAVGHFENNVVGGLVDGRYWPRDASTLPDNVTARELCFIFAKPYSETLDPTLAVNMSNNASTPMMWVMVCSRRNATAWAAGDQFLINANHPNATGVDAFTYAAQAPKFDATVAKQDVGNINVFPNPYYGVNTQELNKYQRFVTFSHLPNVATIRIFDLAGVMVRRIDKNSTGQFERWDLANDSGLPVGSGMYLAYIDMPQIGTTKILKIAIIQEQQVLDRF